MATSTWADEILSGVTTVHCGNAGFLIVYGQQADAILTSDQGEVLIAAAELGKGRVVVTSHEIFPKQFGKAVFPDENATLLMNIKKWVSHGSGENEDVKKIDNIKAWDLVEPCKLIAWKGTQKSKAFVEGLIGWVENGGGMVCGMRPWSLSISVEMTAIASVLRTLGMAYAGKSRFSLPGPLSVDMNCARFARIDNALNVVLQRGDTSKVRLALSNISYIGDDVIESIRAKVSTLKQEYQCVPSREDPIRKDEVKLITAIVCQLYEKEGKSGNTVRAEGIQHFPGDFDTPPKLETIGLTIHSTCHRIHPTGCYVPPGTCMTVICSGPIEGKWTIIVGAHRDKLYKVEKGWRRWPKVTIKREVSTRTLKISSPFGGLVYVQSPEKASNDATLEFEFQNVVPAPRFTYDRASQWETVEVKKPGLWCDVSGDLITFTLPSASVRHLPDLTQVMQMWDRVVGAHMDLRGCDPSGGRGQWVVSDEQISKGAMHSGYPIVTHLNVADPHKNGGKQFLLNAEKFQTLDGTGFWGLFHELGHNYQNPAWTWTGCQEVTCNIFALHATEVIYGVKPWDNSWLQRQKRKLADFFVTGAEYSDWKSKAGTALMVFAQQARDLGWDAFKKIFREYEHLSKEEKPKGDEEEVSQWITRLSIIAQKNLCPAYEFWGIPVDEQAKRLTGHLPPYLPMDETTTEIDPERANFVARKYNMNWE